MSLLEWLFPKRYCFDYTTADGSYDSKTVSGKNRNHAENKFWLWASVQSFTVVSATCGTPD